MKIKGAIKVVGATIQVSAKFSKRELVITMTEEMYPQDILVQFTQDKCALLDGIDFGIGQTVEVSINLRGREWTSPTGEVKYFNTLEAWKIEVA
jgi:hypothetical protein